MKKIIFSVIGITLIFGLVGVASAAESWNLQGTYTIDFECESGCSGIYPHTMDVDLMDLETGEFSGTGYYNSNIAYTWDVEGAILDSAINFLVTYTGLNPGYTINATGIIANDGTMSGTAGNSSQTFNWSTVTGAAIFQRYAEITSPEIDEIAYNEVEFAAYLVDNDSDYVDWAVRKGTCAAGTNTVFGNVDGHDDAFNESYNPPEYKYSYSITADVSAWDAGMYCFIFNPREDAGETNIRLTREFYIADGYVKGGGQIREYLENGKSKDDYKISFGGQVWDLGSEGYMGDWQINFHNVVGDNYDKATFHATEVSVINFYSGNSNTYNEATKMCDEAMNMTLIGTLDGKEGYSIIFRAGDYGTGRDHETPDTVRIELFKGDAKIYDTHKEGEFTDESDCVGTARTGLDAGNIIIEYK